MELYMGQILFCAFNFAPKNYAFCQGQTIAISQNTALFALLGTTFGGDGSSTFKLPDAQGRTFLGTGQGAGLNPVNLGDIAGTNTVTLTSAEMPAHVHQLLPNSIMMNAMSGLGTADQTNSPTAGAFLGTATTDSDTVSATLYVPAGTSGGTAVPLGGCSASGTTGAAGNNLPLSIMQPYLGINALIVIQGIYPSRQ